MANTFKNKTDEEVQAKIRQIVSLIFDGKIVEEIKRKEEMAGFTCFRLLEGGRYFAVFSKCRITQTISRRFRKDCRQADVRYFFIFAI